MTSLDPLTLWLYRIVHENHENLTQSFEVVDTVQSHMGPCSKTHKL